jgi:hypothetical protein
MQLFRIEVGLLGREEIFLMLKEKFSLAENIAKAVATMADGSSIRQLLELADLVDNKNSVADW